MKYLDLTPEDRTNISQCILVALNKGFPQNTDPLVVANTLDVYSVLIRKVVSPMEESVPDEAPVVSNSDAAIPASS